MTYRPDFSGCCDKIDRAWVHRHSLNAEIGPLFLGEANQVRIVGKFDSESSYHVFRTVAIPDFPLRYFGILIGDVIHNFRCVLDHIVWQLACYKTNGAGPPTERRARKVGFPIQVDPPSANIVPEKFADGGALKDVLPDHRAIIHEFQPYKRTYPKSDELAILQSLSNTDKHRVINPVLISTDKFLLPYGILDAVGVENFVVSTDKRLELGAEVFRAPLSPVLPEPHMDVEGHSTPDIVLPQGSSVIEGLDDIGRRVTEILRRFEPLF
jgi:hypothetical protein